MSIRRASRPTPKREERGIHNLLATGPAAFQEGFLDLGLVDLGPRRHRLDGHRGRDTELLLQGMAREGGDSRSTDMAKEHDRHIIIWRW